jgi:Cu(I)/Ag(I) efflux system membrane protein CusA/SilA
LRAKATLKAEPNALQLDKIVEKLTDQHSASLVEAPRKEEMTQLVTSAADALAELGVIARSADLLAPATSTWRDVKDAVRTILGYERSSLSGELFDRLQRRLNDGWIARVKTLNWELEDRSGQTMDSALVWALRRNAEASQALARPPTDAEIDALIRERADAFGRRVFLHHTTKNQILQEMDSALQVPGWGNIWTQPIINRVDMLATGVRTMIGVKVFGPRLEDQTSKRRNVETSKPNEDTRGIQTISNEIAAVLKTIPGAVDVFPDQVVGRSYLQIEIDREKAARYGVNVGDIQEAIEVAMGGKEVTTTVEGRQRFAVRVRYARDFWQTREALERILVTGRRQSTAGSGAGGPQEPAAKAMAAQAEQEGMVSGGGEMIQIPITQVADLRVVEGPSVIKSENGMLRSYVQLNVRDRDIVGFVEEAQRAVAEKIKIPPGFFLEWSGQFEHQVRAKKTLQIIFPLVILLIFIILYMTFRDVRDALLIILAVPGALVGGVIFQSLFGFNFSVAVWVGYIACFGMATQTGIVMLVYLHEAINARGGLAKIGSLAEVRQAVIEGAVHRLRPKLMTEGVAIVGLMPMLWATGVGAEVMRPMAAPVLGGLLVADEVIDLLIPVIFNWYQCRSWRRMNGN